MKLTKANVQRLSLPSGVADKIFFDDELPGFGLRLRAGGKRVWLAQYRVGIKQRRVTLGTVETTDAEEARKRAKGILSKVQLGQDPQIEKAEARAQASVTLGVLINQYLVGRAKKRLKPRSYEEVERHLRKHFAALSGLPAKKVSRANIATQLNKIANENGPFAANRARAAMSSLYSWAMGEGLADANPVVGTNKAIEEFSRDRVLSDRELALIWKEVGEGDYADIVRLLILTGQRREEVGGMLWSEIDEKRAVWTIGADRTKNGQAHDVPLADAALSILKDRQRKLDRDRVFGTGEGAFQGWSNAKAALDSRILKENQNADGRVHLETWRLHDIRRTVATRLAELGVLPHVIESILNHISGHKAGVAGIYNRATYSSDKRRALNFLAEHLSNIVEKRDQKIVGLRVAK